MSKCSADISVEFCSYGTIVLKVLDIDEKTGKYFASQF